MRASMEPPARCASWAAMGPTVLEVSPGEGRGQRPRTAQPGQGRGTGQLLSSLVPPPVCDCAHGLCQEGLQGDGSCVCNVGWQGPRCDQSE